MYLSQYEGPVTMTSGTAKLIVCSRGAFILLPIGLSSLLNIYYTHHNPRVIYWALRIIGLNEFHVKKKKIMTINNFCI